MSCANVVSAEGAPPLLAMCDSPAAAVGVKMIDPSAFHAPPLPSGTSAMVRGSPPLISTIFSLSSAKKAIDRPSSDQNGYSAPSVPGSDRKVGALRSRSHNIVCPFWTSARAMRPPSGEIVKGPGPPPAKANAAPGGNGIDAVSVGETGGGGVSNAVTATVTSATANTAVTIQGRSNRGLECGMIAASDGG